MSQLQHTMRMKDRLAFRDAAQHFGCWILVRAINPDSIRYLDDPRYTPKPVDCKPKTADADVGGRNLAGLVIVPEIHGAGAFRGGKFSKAQSCWKSFLSAKGVVMAVGPGAPGAPGANADRALREARALNATHGDYGVDLNERSRHFGVLQFRGKWIHGDFDLKDIILEGQERRNLASVETMRDQPHMRGPRYFKIRDFINTRLGKDLIQHGGEAQFADHGDDFIDVFGPHGEHTQLGSAEETAAWYRWRERDVIDLARAGPQMAVPAGTPERLRAGFRVVPGGRGR